MSKKQKTSKPNSLSPKAFAQEKPSPASTSIAFEAQPIAKWFAIVILLVVVFAAFSGGFKNQFVDWDDHVYIENNYLVTQPKGHWAEAFKSHVALNYHPLTIWSLMVNASLSGVESAKAFIVTNYLIHSVNVLLVFWLVLLLSGRQLLPSFFAALLFAVHPMRVESVTWVSERKDVLYGLFFIASSIAYLYYIDKGYQKKYLILSFILFFLSCLSKAQAVVLPVVLLLLDYWRNRKFDLKSVLEKAPFFICSLLFGLIATNIQSGGDFHGTIHIIGEQRTALNLQVFSLFQRLQYAGYGFLMYFYHLFLPLNLSAFYPYESTGPNVKFYSIGLVIMLITLVATVLLYKRSKLVFFSIGFFAVTVALVLQFISVGAAIMADRYTYIPYIGLFFLLGMGLQTIAEKNASLKQAVWIMGFAFVGFCFFQTKSQVAIWQNTGTLFGQIIRVYPNDYRAYHTLGKYLGEKEGRLDESIQNNLKAIELGYKDDSGPWENLGTAYGMKGDTPTALKYFDEAIRRGAKTGEAYMNRGIAYFTLQQPQKALPDFEKSLTLPNKKILQSRTFLAAAYLATGNVQKSLEAYNNLIDKEGINDPLLWFNRALARQQLGDRQGAIRDFKQVLSLQPNNEAAKQNLKNMGG